MTDMSELSEADLIFLLKGKKLFERLNAVYGGGSYLLSKKRYFTCQKCGCNGTFTPSERIDKKKYDTIPHLGVHHLPPGGNIGSFDQVGLPVGVVPFYEIVFLVECASGECYRENRVHSPITLGHALKELEEIKAGKNPIATYVT